MGSSGAVYHLQYGKSLIALGQKRLAATELAESW